MRPLLTLLLWFPLLHRVASEDPVLVYGPLYGWVQLYPKFICPGSEALLAAADSFTWQHLSNDTWVTVVSCVMNSAANCSYDPGWTVEWDDYGELSSLNLHFAAPWEAGNYTWSVNTSGNVTFYSLFLQLVDTMGTLRPARHSFCPQYWVGYGDKCYYSHRVSLSYNDSLIFCQGQQAVLAMPKTMELFFLLSHPQQTFWIGLQKQNGAWTWGDGTPYALPVPINGRGTLGNLFHRGIDALNDTVKDFSYCEKNASWITASLSAQRGDRKETPQESDDPYPLLLFILMIIALQSFLFLLWFMGYWVWCRPRVHIGRLPPVEDDKTLLMEHAPWNGELTSSAWQEP